MADGGGGNQGGRADHGLRNEGGNAGAGGNGGAASVRLSGGDVAIGAYEFSGDRGAAIYASANGGRAGDMLGAGGGSGGAGGNGGTASETILGQVVYNGRGDEADAVFSQSSLTESTVAGLGGGTAGLRFGAAEQTSVPLTVGGRAGSDFQLGGGHVLSLSAELGWVHEFNPQRSVTAAFVAAPNVPFQVLGVSASRNSALTGLDAKLSLTHSVALLGSVTGRFAGAETAVGGFGGLQATW